MLYDFTFQDSGKKIQIRKISPMLAADVAASIPEPQPPMNEVDYGAPRGKVMEPNLSDPTYTQALKARQEKVFQALQRVMITRAVVLDGDEWKQEVADYRAFIQQETGSPLVEQNDLLVYVLRVCVGSQEDLADLLTAITTRSQPTQEEIERSKASFRGKV